MSKKYALGLDYGTLSARSILVDVSNGEVLGTASFDYPHAVLDECLPDGTPLGMDWALQDPQDYLDALAYIIPDVIRQTGVNPVNIIGVGTDFTACTVLPVMKDGTPLCFFEEYKNKPHAYPKLWRHHAAQYLATELNKIAEARQEPWLPLYGGKISSEWEIPKLWQILKEAPEIFDAFDLFIEGGDWLTWQLTGNLTRNSSAAGFKGMYHKRWGYPNSDFYKALDPRLEHIVGTKIPAKVDPIGTSAGGITKRIAELTGLIEGTPVAVSTIDAHVTIPAAKIYEMGKMLGIMGTSTCHILLSKEDTVVPGMSGVVEDGAVPGCFGYEAGQACVGDHFAWAVKNCTPPAYYELAKARGTDIHEYLTELADKQEPGESGLVALDWWNGNRSVLVDADLTGMLVGMTLSTKPEDIYRALIEATAYGTRKIVEEFRAAGVKIDEFYAAGGISQKNKMAMQIYSDVLNMPVSIASSKQAPALGAAIFGAVAAGEVAGGYKDLTSATMAMGRVEKNACTPIAKNVAVYDKLYEEYITLHDYFGRGANDVMKRLRSLRKGILTKKHGV